MSHGVIKLCYQEQGNGIIEPLSERIIGRVLAEDIIDPKSGEKIASASILENDGDKDGEQE